MRTMLKTSLILAALLIAVPACGSNSSGSDSSDALVGEWTGKCTATNDQDGSRVADDVGAKLRFVQDGKYFQSTAGPDGGQLEGTYTVTAQTIALESDGDSIDSNYSIKDGVLTTKTQAESDGVPVTSTCTLRRSSDG
ncbi:MAG: hypothetical protein ACRDRZ_04570 [Pseudonocardiaceae bacterium]